MKFLKLFIALAFAMEKNTEKNGEIFEQSSKFPILVKIEEEEYGKKQPSSKYFGVSHNNDRWQARRWRKQDKKKIYYGCYKNEETAAHASDTLARKLMGNGEQNHRLNFPDDNTEVYPEKTSPSKYVGLFYNDRYSKWKVMRRSKHKKSTEYNGYYKDEETAAHASDTLARKLMANGERNHKLNFPDDDTEVHAKRNKTSKFIGVSCNGSQQRWQAYRRSKNGKNMIFNGTYKDEETAAHASDNLARKLMANGEQNHKLNFPDDDIEVNQGKKTTSSKYFGVTYILKYSKWHAQRWSKSKKKPVRGQYFEDEETAAHASDDLARKLIANGEKNHKFNFPDDAEVHSEKFLTNKRKRDDDLNESQPNSNYEKFD